MLCDLLACQTMLNDVCYIYSLMNGGPSCLLKNATLVWNGYVDLLIVAVKILTCSLILFLSSLSSMYLKTCYSILSHKIVNQLNHS